jgi:glutamate dehydrogenase
MQTQRPLYEEIERLLGEVESPAVALVEQRVDAPPTLADIRAAVGEALAGTGAAAVGELRGPGDRDRPVAQGLLEQAWQLGTAAQRRARQAYAQWLIDDLVDPELARFLASAGDLAVVPDVAVVTAAVPDRAAAEVADVALRLGEWLGVDRLEAYLQRAELGEGWGRRQHRGLARDLRRLRRVAARSAFLARPEAPADKVAEGFLEDRHTAVARALLMVRDAERTEGGVLDAVAVAARSIREAIDPTTR